MTVNVATSGGDLVTVEPAVIANDQPAVRLSVNAVDGSLTPAEAVRLGVELIATAHRSEMRSPDDWTEEASDE